MSSSAATLSNILAQMNQDGEVLQGWDAVMNLLESSVNSFFQEQWKEHTSGSDEMKISEIWCDGIHKVAGKTFTEVTQVEIQLGSPLFQFKGGSNSVTVTQKILGGEVKQGTMVVESGFDPSSCGCKIDDDKVQWQTPVQKIDPSTGPTLNGAVALTQVKGKVTGSHSLALDFAQGAFTLGHLTIHGVKNSTIVDQIKNWFATQEIVYVVASVNFTDVSGQPGLTPTSFQFAVYDSDAGNTIVQILITTDGSAPGTTQINVDEPVPTADGLTCSLMVSSRILYNDVLVKGFNQHGTSFSLVPEPPGSVGEPWHASISPEMHFAGHFSFGSCCDRTTVTYSIYLGGTYAGSTTEGFHLSQHVHTHGNAPVDIDVSANYPVTLSGSGESQQINITPGTPSVHVTGSVESQITSRLQTILNDDLHNSMAGISFTPVTFFALKNLLFPGNLIKMSQAQVPSDLLIVGTFESS